MTPQLWSWLLAAIGVTGIALAGRARPAIGWTVGLTAQLLWVAYALATGQYGFLASAAAYGAVYGWNLRKALRPTRPSLTAAVLERIAADARRAAQRLHADGYDVAAVGGYLRPGGRNTATATGPGAVAIAGATGPNAVECPLCPDHRRIALPLVAGHLYRHALAGQS